MSQTSEAAFEVVILGSGPGGYVAALQAAAAGLRTAVVEKDEKFGGTCLHVGCIPSKVFLHTASLLDEIRTAKTFGVTVSEPNLDWGGLQRRNRRVIGKLAGGVALLLRRAGVACFRGTGRLAGPGRVEVQPPETARPPEAAVRVLTAPNIIIATGSEARTLPFLNLDGDRIVTNAEMFDLPECPARLGIIGAGAVGAEFASMFRAFGTQVDLFEALPRVLPLEDAEVSEVVEKAFRRRRIGVKTGVAVEGAEPSGSGVAVRYLAGGRVECAEYDRLLVAVGRAPRTAGIGLETVGLEPDSGGVLAVDDSCRTQAAGVFAISAISNCA